MKVNTVDSNFKVALTQIVDIAPHPNPVVERLEIATVYGFQVIVGKGTYKVGQKVIYLPVNSILPRKLETFLFPPDSKITLDKSRIKACKIQQFVSQGMIAPWEEIKNLYKLEEFPLETDLQLQLNVVKYYPPVMGNSFNTVSSKPIPKIRNKPKNNIYFKEYNGCTNINWVPNAFTEEDIVWISEKIHGSSWRAAYLPNSGYKISYPNFKLLLHKKTIKNFFSSIKQSFISVVDKFKEFFKLSSEFEFCYGSNTVQRQKKTESPTWYGEDIYAQMCKDYSIKEKLKDYPGYVLYGEIYGPNVQKGYHYGLKNGERKLIIFDVMYQTKTDQTWLSCEDAYEFCKKLELPFVPILYKGKWDKTLAINLAKGNSILCPTQKVIEGVVVKNDNVLNLNRRKIKIINPEYTMKEAKGETTDFTEIEGEVFIDDFTVNRPKPAIDP